MARRLLCEKITGKISSSLFSKILCFDSVSSTNTVSLEQALQSPSEEFVVLADSQTGGKGRHGRTWFSPPGKNIHMSILLRPNIKISDASLLTILSAVAVCEVLRDISGLAIRIKWPNDLVFKGKKLGGILIETRTEHSLVTIAVIGIGLNIDVNSSDLPAELREKASSLFIESSRNFDREEIVLKVLEHISNYYKRLFVPSADTMSRIINPAERKYIVDRWRSLDTVLGKKISVTTSIGMLTGEAIAIDDTGMLDLLCNDGKIEKIHTGDIVIL